MQNGSLIEIMENTSYDFCSSNGFSHNLTCILKFVAYYLLPFSWYWHSYWAMYLSLIMPYVTLIYNTGISSIQQIRVLVLFISNFIFFFQSRVGYGRINFQPKCCVAVSHSIHFQSWLLNSCLCLINLLPSFALRGGRSYVFSPFLSRFVVYMFWAYHARFSEWMHIL